MLTVDIHELEEHTREVLRQVEDGETVEVTNQGRAVARLIPIAQLENKQAAEAHPIDINTLVDEISAYWPEGVSAVDAVRDVRRDI